MPACPAASLRLQLPHPHTRGDQQLWQKDPASRLSLLLFHGFPSQTHPGPHGSPISAQSSPLSCLWLYCMATSPSCRQGSWGMPSAPSSTQNEPPNLSPQLSLHGGAQQALEPVDTLEHLLYASCPDRSVSATAPGSNWWPPLFPLQPHLSLPWEPTCPLHSVCFSPFL